MADARCDAYFEDGIPYYANDWRVLGKIIKSMQEEIASQKEQLKSQQKTIDLMLRKRFAEVSDPKPPTIVSTDGTNWKFDEEEEEVIGSRYSTQSKR